MIFQKRHFSAFFPDGAVGNSPSRCCWFGSVDVTDAIGMWNLKDTIIEESSFVAGNHNHKQAHLYHLDYRYASVVIVSCGNCSSSLL